MGRVAQKSKALSTIQAERALLQQPENPAHIYFYQKTLLWGGLFLFFLLADEQIMYNNLRKLKIA